MKTSIFISVVAILLLIIMMVGCVTTASDWFRAKDTCDTLHGRLIHESAGYICLFEDGTMKFL